MVVSRSQPLVGILLSACVIFAILLLCYVFWQESVKERRQKIETTPAHEIQSPEPVNCYPKAVMPVPDSIIENTTELLQSKKTNKPKS